MTCLNCQTKLPPGAHFCMNCGQPVSDASSTDQTRRSRLAAAAPPALVEKARAANSLSGERRNVTAMFIDVVGSRALAQKLGKLKAEEIIYEGLDIACPITYRYEGTIAHLQDDEMLIFFGAPVAHEDDPVRAVRAALEVLSEIKTFSQTTQQNYGTAFSVRISLSTGPVTIGPIGDKLIYEYTAFGSSLNLAQRLEATKLADSVLVSESTFRFVAPFCTCDDLGFVEIPGNDKDQVDQIRIYQVKGLQAIPEQNRGLAGLHSPMVGRTGELETLMQLSRAVLIQGEPGLGKTRLLMEWYRALDQSGELSKIQWNEGRCLSFGQNIAYHLVSSLLHNLIGILDSTEETDKRRGLLRFLEKSNLDPNDQKEIFPHLSRLIGLKLELEFQEQMKNLDPEAHQTLSQDAFRRLLTARCSQRPQVIVLEDLHWADPSSISFLSPLLSLAVNEPILFCLVMREERESAGWQLVEASRLALRSRLTILTLKTLTSTESRQLVSNLLQIEALPNHIREIILQKAEGNPFFVEEVIRMLIDRGAITLVDGHWQSGANVENIDIPDNLQGLLLARIDRLPEEVRQTLRIAAVIGRQFPLKVLEHIITEQIVQIEE